jgi:hypothetical protein
MSYKITYTSKWSGKETTHTNTNSRADAEGWARTLSTENGSKAVCEHVADGPYDYSGKTTHIISIGDDKT